MGVGGAGVGAWVGAWKGAWVGVEVCAPPPPVLGPIMYTLKKIIIIIIIRSRLSLIVREKVGIGLLLLTVTDVSTTRALVIFRVKVSCITLY